MATAAAKPSLPWPSSTSSAAGYLHFPAVPQSERLIKPSNKEERRATSEQRRPAGIIYTRLAPAKPVSHNSVRRRTAHRARRISGGATSHTRLMTQRMYTQTTRFIHFSFVFLFYFYFSILSLFYFYFYFYILPLFYFHLHILFLSLYYFIKKYIFSKNVFILFLLKIYFFIKYIFFYKKINKQISSLFFSILSLLYFNMQRLLNNIYRKYYK